MKRQIPLIIGILGFSTGLIFPAVAQANRIENFFNGIPNNRHTVNGPLDRGEKTENSSRNAQQSTQTRPAASSDQGNQAANSARYDLTVPPDTLNQLDAAPGTPKQNRAY